MNSNLSVVSFRNTNNLKLFGILHSPQNTNARDITIILLSPGIKSRVAPHRLYIKLAQSFVDLGFPVFRFDFHGLGDSEGEIDEEYSADLYGSIELGRYVDDTICALNWLNSEYNTQEFILAGLCGGAITGFLSASKDSRVKGILGMALPVILASSNISYDRFLTPTELKLKRDFYLSKLSSFGAWKSWIRFFTFQSDYRLILKSIFQPISSFFRSKTIQLSESDTIFNPHFQPAFKKLISNNCELLLIFAEMDKYYFQFRENFLVVNNINLEDYPQIEYYAIKDSNHIFAFKAWQDELIHISKNWLNAKFE